MFAYKRQFRRIGDAGETRLEGADLDRLEKLNAASLSAYECLPTLVGSDS